MKHQDNEIFRGLADSAIDFLKLASGFLQSNPKLSLIMFATAVELLVKARLYSIHWAFLTVSPGKIGHEKIGSNDISTVGAQAAIERLNVITDGEIYPDAKSAIDTLFNDRNTVVHFYHEALVPLDQGQLDAEDRESKKISITPDEKKIQGLREAVVVRQLKVWHHIYQLLVTQWSVVFSPYLEDVKAIQEKMLADRVFLNQRFIALRGHIEGHVSSGGACTKCYACGQWSVLGVKKHFVCYGKCVVCDHEQNSFLFDCPEQGCNGVMQMWGGNNRSGRCRQCNKEMYIEEAFKQLKLQYAESGVLCEQCYDYRRYPIEPCIYVEGDESEVYCLDCGSVYHSWFTCKQCLYEVAPIESAPQSMCCQKCRTDNYYHSLPDG